MSWGNAKEAAFIVKLLAALAEFLVKNDSGLSSRRLTVGIIAPYFLQAKFILRDLRDLIIRDLRDLRARAAALFQPFASPGGPGSPARPGNTAMGRKEQTLDFDVVEIGPLTVEVSTVDSFQVHTKYSSHDELVLVCR